MRRHDRPVSVPTVLQLLVVWLLSACGQAHLEHASPVAAENRDSTPVAAKAEALAYEVVRVIDGDTIVVKVDNADVTVRLIGVDTPETVHPQKPVEFFGKEASAFTTNLLAGEQVFLEYEEGSAKTDKYGRTLAYVYRAPDRQFVNYEIVRQGYGHAYTTYPFSKMEAFRQAEREARQSGKGLWNGEASASAPVEVTSPAGEEAEEPPAPVQDVTVCGYSTWSKYHRVCGRCLKQGMIPMPLSEAKRSYGPCSVCKPSG